MTSYPSDVDKAAALFHAIVSDHPFADGNKRTATVSTITLLVAMGVIPDVPIPLQVRLLGEIAVETAQGKLGVDEVGTWLSRIFDLS